MINKPTIRLRDDAKWRLEDDFWFVVEPATDIHCHETIVSSDGESVIVTEGGDAMSIGAHNMLAVLDNSGALDEYLRSRESRGE